MNPIFPLELVINLAIKEIKCLRMYPTEQEACTADFELFEHLSFCFQNLYQRFCFSTLLSVYFALYLVDFSNQLIVISLITFQK